MTSVATFTLGRLVLGAPSTPLVEPLGDPVGSQGGAAVPASRTAPQFQVALATYLVANPTVAQGQLLRRALRSLLNNTPLKLQGFLYVVYSDDTEQNGWYVPDVSTLSAIDRGSWKAVGLWQTGTGNWLLAGRRRTHREGREVWMKNLTTDLYPRDQLGLIVSSDFSALPTLQLTTLPNGATGPVVTVSGQVLAPVALPTGRDGGVCQLVSGQSDMTVISYERAESALNLSDVIVYDRRGQITAPAGGPDTSWEEVYGPDYPWNWTTGGANDIPVLDNGLVRVRYDGTNTPGFRVDVWNGSAYVEQGKMLVQRVGDSTGFDDTFGSAFLEEYTPDRAVIGVVLSRAADAYSREQAYITMQRGELGLTFECYPALKSAGGQADMDFAWQPALNAGSADVVDAAFKSDTQTLPAPQGTGVISVSPVGGSGATWANNTLGASNFATSENYVALLRELTAIGTVSAYQATLAVLQAANVQADVGNGTVAYGVANGDIALLSQNTPGYVQVQLQFSATQSDQVLQASTFRNASGTTSQNADAGAYNGQNVKDTQTAQTNATCSKTSNLLQAKYRVFIRVKVDSPATGSFQVKLGAVGSYTVTTTSTTYTILDLGDVLATGANPTLAAYGWRSSGASGSVYIDRVWCFAVEDRTRGSAIYSGCRDAGQAALQDGRTLGLLLARG